MLFNRYNLQLDSSTDVSRRSYLKITYFYTLPSARHVSIALFNIAYCYLTFSVTIITKKVTNFLISLPRL